MNMFSDTHSFWGDRLKASTLHLGLSLCIAALAALLVFAVWYPNPYREISGGRELPAWLLKAAAKKNMRS